MSRRAKLAYRAERFEAPATMRAGERHAAANPYQPHQLIAMALRRADSYSLEPVDGVARVGGELNTSSLLVYMAQVIKDQIDAGKL